MKSRMKAVLEHGLLDITQHQNGEGEQQKKAPHTSETALRSCPFPASLRLLLSFLLHFGALQLLSLLLSL